MNRYSPYHNHDEGCTGMMFDEDGSWVHISKARDLLRERDEARAERDEALGDARLAECQLDEIVELVGSGGDGSAFGSVESLLCDLKERTEECDKARAEIKQLREIIKTAGDRLNACGDKLTEFAYQEMASVLFDLPVTEESE